MEAQEILSQLQNAIKKAEDSSKTLKDLQSKVSNAVKDNQGAIDEVQRLRAALDEVLDKKVAAVAPRSAPGVRVA